MLSPRPNEETRAYATKHYTEILEVDVVVLRLRDKSV